MQPFSYTYKVAFGYKAKRQCADEYAVGSHNPCNLLNNTCLKVYFNFQGM
jgi:hypothetical protein